MNPPEARSTAAPQAEVPNMANAPSVTSTPGAASAPVAASAVSTRQLPARAWSAPRLARVLAATAILLAFAGLVAGSTGWSFAWSDDWTLILAIRAPRTAGAFLAGGLLGLGGAIAQGVFRNPLADPYLLGSASGATLAIVVALSVHSLGGHPIGITAANWLLRLGLVGSAFLGALGGISLTLTLARGAERPTVLLLAGVVVGVLLGAIANLLALLSPEALRGTQVFLLGTTGFLGWSSVVPLAAALAVSLLSAVRFARVLDALVLGEATATTLGIAVPRVRLMLIVLLAICAGTAVAETGLIAFVGLVAPHIVRRSVIVTHTGLLLLATLAGGVLLLASDVAARTLLAPQELPVGLLTAILGGSYLLALLHRRTGAAA